MSLLDEHDVFWHFSFEKKRRERQDQKGEASRQAKQAVLGREQAAAKKKKR